MTDDDQATTMTKVIIPRSELESSRHALAVASCLP